MNVVDLEDYIYVKQYQPISKVQVVNKCNNIYQDSWQDALAKINNIMFRVAFFIFADSNQNNLESHFKLVTIVFAISNILGRGERG